MKRIRADKLSAKELANEARSHIELLAQHPRFNSRSELFRALSDQSGLSVTLIQDFQARRRKNCGIVALDQIRDGIMKTFLDMTA